MSLKLNTDYLEKFISSHELAAVKSEVIKAHSNLYKNAPTALGNDFHGWLHLPDSYDKEEFLRIRKCADKIMSDSDVLVVIGIGGSYLGARAAIEFVKSKNYNLIPRDTPKIFFLGNSLSPTEISEIYNICENCDFSVNVISKSGTTTEPAIAFRIFKGLLEKKYGKSTASKRIYVTTDRHTGTLKELAAANGYETFVVPDDVGGRFSVLTAVGLLPIACAGINIEKLMAGAQTAVKKYAVPDADMNDCCKYAALRNILYRKGKSIEMFVSYEPDFTMMNEWLKQLFGESEGKNGMGLFPASAIYSTDLHSLGQYVQDGRRLMFETAVIFGKPKTELVIEEENSNGDGLNFLAGSGMSYVNRKAFEGTVLAHTDGGVPNIVIECGAMDEENLGELIYFFEKACAVSAYMLGVNPFDQPGVESYKKNMFALLGKPGYEKLGEELKKRLG